jgi:predicted ATPase
MSEHRHHERLRLRDFTAFQDATLRFSPGVNVFVGANGTGKTHVMKALYAWQLNRSRDNGTRFGNELFFAAFQVEKEIDLVRMESERRHAIVTGAYSGKEWEVVLQRGPQPAGTGAERFTSEQPGRPVFIPAIDMMGHTKRFLTTYDDFRIDFDLTHRDIVGLLLGPERREPSEMIGALEGLFPRLGGEIMLEDERFYLSNAAGRLPMPIVAEGLRKVATLVQLVRNGWLEPGGTLFWDEPEVNVNPILMEAIVGAILALARRGVQIFLATHSYVILKEIDLQTAKEPGLAEYFAFDASDGPTTVSQTNDFSQLSPNRILDEYSSLYDRELVRATGGPLNRDHRS